MLTIKDCTEAFHDNFCAILAHLFGISDIMKFPFTVCSFGHINGFQIQSRHRECQKMRHNAISRKKRYCLVKFSGKGLRPGEEGESQQILLSFSLAPSSKSKMLISLPAAIITVI